MILIIIIIIIFQWYLSIYLFSFLHNSHYNDLLLSHENLLTTFSTPVKSAVNNNHNAVLLSSSFITRQQNIIIIMPAEMFKPTTVVINLQFNITTRFTDRFTSLLLVLALSGLLRRCWCNGYIYIIIIYINLSLLMNCRVLPMIGTAKYKTVARYFYQP